MVKMGLRSLEITNIKYIALTVLLTLSLFLSSCGDNSGLIPQVLAKNTENIIGLVKEDSDAVFVEIQRNIDLVKSLKDKVQDAQLTGTSISLLVIISDIETVAESYKDLASQRDDIRKRLINKIVALEDMRDAVESEIRLLRERQEDYTIQLNSVNNPDPEIVRTRKKALTQAIKYVDAQIRLWTQFSTIERDIVIEMGDIERRIDSFLSMIESSSIVFQEGLNLLYLQRDINEALSLFTSDIPQMEQLILGMEDSWSNLDYLLDSLIGISNVEVQ